MRKYFSKGYWKRLRCKMTRQKGTPESQALGFAIGLFTGFAIPTGFQLIAALALAFAFKANKTLAIAGTMITNLYTAPFFMALQCWLGAAMLGEALTLATINQKVATLLAAPSWDAAWSLGSGFLWPLLLGGLVLSLAFSIPGYYATLWVARVQQSRRKEKLRLRRMKELGLKSGCEKAG